MHTYNSPPSTLTDGVFQILVVRGSVSRYRMARILLGLASGSHCGMPGAQFIAANAFRLEPTSNGSFNDLDGEVVESGSIQGVVLPKSWTVFG